MVFAVAQEKMFMGKAVDPTLIDTIRNGTATANKTTFEAQTPYVQIPEVSTRGSVGFTRDLNKFSSITSAMENSTLGLIKLPDIECEIFWDSALAVINDIQAAANSKFLRAFKIEVDDKGPGIGATNTIIYSLGYISGFEITGGDVNAGYMAKFTLSQEVLPVIVKRIIGT